MRKMILGAAVVAALIGASVAIADGIGGARSLTAVSGTFSASASDVKTKSCTTTDGKALTITDARYTGAASGSPDLTGTITLIAHSLIDTTDNVGVVDGTLRIATSGKPGTRANFTAVYGQGTVAGLANGRAHGPSSRLVANLSASFNPSTGFTGGKLGGGTAAGNAVEVSFGRCARVAPPKPQKSQAKGTITTLQPTSITVATVTCAIPSDQSSRILARFKQGDRVVIHCLVENGTNTLTKIERTG